jgi:hypothetical protein
MHHASIAVNPKSQCVVAQNLIIRNSFNDKVYEYFVFSVFFILIAFTIELIVNQIVRYV